MSKEEFESLQSPEAAKIQLTPRQKLQRHNLAVFFVRAANAERYCKHCNWPMDPEPVVEGREPFDRCIVCIEMETVLWRSRYFQLLDAKEKLHRRRKFDQD